MKLPPFALMFTQLSCGLGVIKSVGGRWGLAVNKVLGIPSTFQHAKGPSRKPGMMPDMPAAIFSAAKLAPSPCPGSAEADRGSRREEGEGQRP